MERKLTELIEWLKDAGAPNPQGVLRQLDAEELPEQFRDALRFWQSLSGPSRNFMYEVACGRRLKKTAPVSKGKRIRLSHNEQWPKMPKMP